MTAMTEREQRAAALFKKGYNCAQAVFAVYAEEMGLDEQTALRLSSSFGGGMGRLREVCGAVSGMFLAAGMLYGYSDPDDRAAKTAHYRRIQELAAAFKEKNGSIVCRELLGLPAGSDASEPSQRTAEYYQKRPCVELVKDAVGVLDEYMAEHPVG